MAKILKQLTILGSTLLLSFSAVPPSFPQRVSIDTEVSEFACSFPNTVKWSSEWEVEYFGKEFIFQAVRYLAEVVPGWIGVVTASATAGGDEMARKLFESLEFTEGRGCFTDEIASLKN